MTDIPEYPPPAFGEALPAARRSEATLQLLALRRSASARALGEPGPDDATLAQLLRIAARTPDHRRVTPFRFIVFQGAARARAGAALEAAFAAAEPAAGEERRKAERERFERAPVVVAVVSRVDREHKTPEWEQVLTAGAVCQNLLIAATAAGFAAQWLTEWCAYDDDVLRAFGLKPAERVAGFIYIGTSGEDPLERARPDMATITTFF